MAAAFYNHLTGTRDADAAGTEVELPGETLGERRQRRGGTNVIQAMLEEGVDVSSSPKIQLVKEMLHHYDRVISMADHQYTPTWLRDHATFEYWEIADPGSKGMAETKVARDLIKQRVTSLTRELQNTGA